MLKGCLEHTCLRAHGGAAGVKVQGQRLEKHTERKDHEWRPEEEADGTHEDDQPPVEESRPLTGHPPRLRTWLLLALSVLLPYAMWRSLLAEGMTRPVNRKAQRKSSLSDSSELLDCPRLRLNGTAFALIPSSAGKVGKFDRSTALGKRRLA
jgi:hypothetical protein